MQPQVDVVRVDRLGVQGGDDRADRDDLDAPARVRADRGGGAAAQQLRRLLGGEPLRAGRARLGGELGAGNQVSRTVPSAAMVARPAATAPVVL